MTLTEQDQVKLNAAANALWNVLEPAASDISTDALNSINGVSRAVILLITAKQLEGYVAAAWARVVRVVASVTRRERPDVEREMDASIPGCVLNPTIADNGFLAIQYRLNELLLERAKRH